MTDKSPFDLPTTGIERVKKEDPPELAQIVDPRKSRARGRTGVQRLSGNAPPLVQPQNIKVLSRIDKTPPDQA